jgi:hypothetical protein
MTSDLQVRIAKAVAEQITKVTGVVSCIVDDYSDYGNFRLFAKIQLAPYAATSRYLRFDDKHVNLRAISQSINCILQKCKVHKEKIVSPKRHYHTSFREKVFEGYEDDSIQIDFVVPEGVTWQDLPKVKECHALQGRVD